MTFENYEDMIVGSVELYLYRNSTESKLVEKIDITRSEAAYLSDMVGEDFEGYLRQYVEGEFPDWEITSYATNLSSLGR